jgi:hypothetical protein
MGIEQMWKIKVPNLSTQKGGQRLKIRLKLACGATGSLTSLEIVKPTIRNPLPRQASRNYLFRKRQEHSGIGCLLRNELSFPARMNNGPSQKSIPILKSCENVARTKKRTLKS